MRVSSVTGNNSIEVFPLNENVTITIHDPDFEGTGVSVNATIDKFSTLQMVNKLLLDAGFHPESSESFREIFYHLRNEMTLAKGREKDNVEALKIYNAIREVDGLDTIENWNGYELQRIKYVHVYRNLSKDR